MENEMKIDSHGTKLVTARDGQTVAAVSRSDFNSAKALGEALVCTSHYEIKLNDHWYPALIAADPNASYVN